MRSCVLGVVLLGFGAACGREESQSSPRADAGSFAGRSDTSDGSAGEAGRSDTGDGSAGAAAHSDAGDGSAGEAGGDAAAVNGTVLDFATNRPLDGCTVFIGGESATTDTSGKFRIDAVSAHYDVVLVEPDDSAISVYRGLTLRAPVLSHRTTKTPPTPSNAASISGNLSGVGAYPLRDTDLVTVYFFSTQDSSSQMLGGALPASLHGPAYGPLTVTWNGSGTISGQLVGLGTFKESGTSYVWAFGQRDVTLTNGVSSGTVLDLRKTTLGSITGRVDTPHAAAIGFKQLAYRLPFPGGIISLLNDETRELAFGYSVPDLSAYGATLCVSAGNSSDFLLTLRCGVELGTTDATLTTEAPPAISSPTDGSDFDRSTVFQWSEFDNGVYLLACDPDVSSRVTPSISVFTSDTHATLPDLNALGLEFPRGGSFTCKVVGLGPYPTLDDAVGANGLGALIPSEARRSYSHAITLTPAP